MVIDGEPIHPMTSDRKGWQVPNCSSSWTA
jgi:hypothetical protein